ncbi:hypothetical protein AK812_SmicGene45836 [Symbiodinium microadriaticum]|uniref:Uncharacterized protein n=1 Tax=Symbiodinium microadriaticum TaxID=2951 RepID=A0A1Q9BV79_SYMMI|nr:hypothetical protein AK812_SmicGene45836 [Symbiodinium microadriaticum]
MLHGEPRRIDVSNRGPMIVVYTDGVLYSRLRGVTRVRYSGAKVPDALVDRWASQGKRHLIGLVEMYVLVLARFAWKEYLDFQRVLFFLDHSGVLASAIKCTSRDELWRELLLQLEIADRGSCVAWYARVPSSSNASDPPSRGNETLISNVAGICQSWWTSNDCSSSLRIRIVFFLLENDVINRRGPIFPSLMFAFENRRRFEGFEGEDGFEGFEGFEAPFDEGSRDPAPRLDEQIDPTGRWVGWLDEIDFATQQCVDSKAALDYPVSWFAGCAD